MAKAGLKATAPTGPYPGLGHLYREIVNGATARDVGRKAFISKSSAWAMSNGDLVGEETLLALAKAYNVSVNSLRHAMDLPVYPVDPVTGKPWLTVGFLLELLDPDLGQRIKALATERGITDGDPEPLVQLLNELLAKGVATPDHNT